MFEKLGNFFNKMMKPEVKELTSKDAAKERLHLVLMQDRANVSVDFLELMKQEIIDVIKKYIVIDESSIDVRLTNQENADGTNGAPSLYANIPILNIKNDVKAEKIKDGTLMYENGELEKAPQKEPEVSEENASDSVIILPEEISKENEEKLENLEETQFVEEIPEDVELPEEATNASEAVTTEEVAEEKTEAEVSETKTTISEEVIAENDEELVIEQEEEEEAIEPVVDFSEDPELDDEDGEDITFDDLLKKAEEEEKANKVEENNSENKPQPKKKKSSSKKKKR
ncbi:MAG: cell division topological specificity factor MinE [Clostridia bacterium]|nr:cell division topological specificity factor MinE [Clostridia bacterium]